MPRLQLDLEMRGLHAAKETSTLEVRILVLLESPAVSLPLSANSELLCVIGPGAKHWHCRSAAKSPAEGLAGGVIAANRLRLIKGWLKEACRVEGDNM